MKVTLALAQFYSNLDIKGYSVEEITEKIGAQLGAVEEVIDLAPRYTGVLVAKVVSCEDHPNADRLHVCKVDDGGKAEGVERDENGHVQVVCGAPNVREGLTVAWLPPGSTVPESYDKEPFVLEARALRGVVSNGMLASPRELGIGDAHEGIMELDDEIAAGTSFIEAYHLDDHIIDIENKMFTHRPDCFGIIGVYRELAGIFGQQLKAQPGITLAANMTSLLKQMHYHLRLKTSYPNLSLALRR
jgi:phenylalanyl-tRNA synthetase beta chain